MSEPSALLRLQWALLPRIAKLIVFAYSQGFTLTMGEGWRSPEECARLAKKKLGIKNSLHGMRLAIDFQVFKDGKYLERTEDYKILGSYWKTLSEPGINCCWGGDFTSRPDGDHFSIEFNHIK